MQRQTQTYEQRLKQQAYNFKQSKYKYFTSNSTSLYTNDEYTESFLYSKHNDFVCGVGGGFVLGGISLVCSLVPAIGIPLIVGGAATIGISLFHSEHAKKRKHEECAAKKAQAIDNVRTAGNILDPTVAARTELEQFIEENRKVSKRDLLARIEMYDDTTKMDLIKEILADKNKKTVLGERFWRREGIFACSPNAGTLCELGHMLKKLENEANDSSSKNSIDYETISMARF